MGKRTFMNGSYQRRGLRRGAGGRGGGITAGGTPPLPVDGAAHRWVTAQANSIVEDGSGVVSWTDIIGGVVLGRTGPTGPTLVDDGQIKQKTLSFVNVAGEPLRNVGGVTSTVMGPGVDSTVIVFGKRLPSTTANWFTAGVDGVSTSDIVLRSNSSGILRGSRAGVNAAGSGILHGDMYNRMFFRWDDAGDAYTYDGNKDFSEDEANAGDPLANQDTFAIAGTPDGLGRAVQSICEVIIYPFRLDDAQLASVDDYLVARYFADVFAELGAVYQTDPDDARSAVEITGQGVSSIKDIIGGGTLVQATDANRPPLITSTVTGRKVTQHTGLEFLSGLAPAASAMGTQGPGTMFAEVVLEGSGTRNMLSTFSSAAPTVERCWLRTHPTSGDARFTMNSLAEGIQNQDDGPLPNATARWFVGAVDSAERLAQVTGEVVGSSATVNTNALGLNSVGLGTNDGIGGGMIGEIGLCLIFPYKLSVAQRLRVTDAIEARWTDVPLALGARSHFRADDATVSAWPDRISGASLPAFGTPVLTTVNGREAVLFDGSSRYQGANSAADSARADLTMYAVYERTGPGAGGETVWGAGQVSGSGQSVRLQLPGTGTDVAVIRRDTANQTNDRANVTFPGQRSTFGIRFDDAAGTYATRADGDELADFSTIRILGTPFTDTVLGENQGGGTGFTGKLMEIVVFDRILNDRDVEVLEAQLNAYYWDWAAPAGTPGSVDNITQRWRGSDYNGATWPAFEGSGLPAVLGLAPPAGLPTQATAPELGGADVVDFDGSQALTLDRGVGSAVTEFFALSIGAYRSSGRVFMYMDTPYPGLAPERAGVVFRAVDSARVEIADAINSVNGDTLASVSSGDAFAVGGTFDVTVTEGAAFLSLLPADRFSSGFTFAFSSMRYMVVGDVDGAQFLDGQLAEIVVGNRRLGDGELAAYVRRLGRFAPALPLPLPAALTAMNLRGDYGITTDPVESWVDFDTMNVATATGTERPTLTQVNGHNALDFDGSDDRMVGDAAMAGQLDGAAGLSGFMVLDLSTVTNGDFLFDFDGGAGVRVHAELRTGMARLRVNVDPGTGTTRTLDAPAAMPTGLVLVDFRMGDTDGELRVDGAVVTGPIDTTGITSIGPHTDLALMDVVGGGGNADGILCQLVFLDHSATDDERDLIFNLLQDRWF